MQTTAIRTVANSLPENKVILLTLLISKRYIPYTDLRKKADSIPISRVKSHKKRGTCVWRVPRWCFAVAISLASNRIFKNVCARREQKPSLLGLCRAAANFRASECNRACSYCRAQPKISKQIFVQASAEPNLFGLCRAQPKMSRKGAFI